MQSIKQSNHINFGWIGVLLFIPILCYLEIYRIERKERCVQVTFFNEQAEIGGRNQANQLIVPFQVPNECTRISFTDDSGTNKVRIDSLIYAINKQIVHQNFKKSVLIDLSDDTPYRSLVYLFDKLLQFKIGRFFPCQDRVWICAPSGNYYL